VFIMATFRLFLGLFLGALLIGGTAMAQPMSGTYTIGDDPEADDYTSFTAAVSDLTGRGVEGPVTFDVEELVYLETITIGQITGASSENRITFRDAVPGGTRPLIKGRASTSTPQGVVALIGADYFTFDGIDVQDTISGVSIRIQGGAWYNTIKNCTVTGFSVTSSWGVYFYGGNGQNGYILIDHVTFNGCYYALASTGGGTPHDQTVEMRYCTVNGCYAAVFYSNVNDVRFHHNDVTAGWDGRTSDVYGVYVSSLSGTDSCFIYNNKIHGMQTNTGTSSFVYVRGIYVYSSPATASVVIYNNMIYDFNVAGTSSYGYVYGMDLDGATCEVYNNSIYVNDNATGGAKYGIYMNGSNLALTLKNNIIVMGITGTRAAYGIYGSQGTLTASDFNCFYNLGGSTGYRMGYYSGARNTLNLWRNYFQGLLPPRDIDLNSVEGNPGYISTVSPPGYNLHINADSGLVHLRGTPIPRVTDDIDGDARWSMPDIGADEYTYLAPANDYWVRGLLGWTWLTPELTAQTTDAIVVNRGSADQDTVKVVFYYDGIPQDSDSVSLDAYTSDTITFNWTTPVAPDTIMLEAQSFLIGDAVPDNDSALSLAKDTTKTSGVRIIAQPMHGTYTIGPTRTDYTTFTAAIADLTVRGVSAAVVFEVAEGTYNEAVVIPAAMVPVQYTGIRGASAENTITFHPAPAHLDTPPEIVSATSPAVNLNGADYITFDGINITCNLAAGKCVQITTGTAYYGGADYNVIKNCTLTGTGESVANNYGVHITGGGNDYNVIDSVNVNRSVYYPVYLAGVTATPDVGNQVRNCMLTGGVQGVVLSYQNGAVVRNCDIQPGYDGAAAEVFGIYVAAQNASQLSTAYANKIHNIRGNVATNGIYAVPGTNTLFMAYNNFVYDYVVTGAGVVYGLRVGSGTSYLYDNSVYIGDVGTTGAAYAFYMTLAAAVVHLKNNVFRVDEPTTACWAIYRNLGTLNSNYNAFYSAGPGALYNLGYAGASYASLWLWNRALGYDAKSVEGNPGFVSATDLHIQPHYSLLNGAGLDTAAITTDIDGNVRGTPPDIGADEYAFAPMDHDYAVVWTDTQYVFVGTVPKVIRAVVKNFGSNAETDAPVRLYYNGVQQDEVLLSLASGAADTVNLDWTPPNPVPPADQEIGTLVIKALCPSDTFVYNDSLKHPVTVRGAPLSGVYDLGGGAMNYATFTAAVNSLTLRGMASEVIFDVYAGTYTANVTIGPIAGANYTDRIIFRKHLNDVVTLTGTARKPLQVVGCDYLTFDGINVLGFASVDTVVVVKGDANYVTFKNLSITGLARTGMSYGLQLSMDGNDNFLADNVTVSYVQYGITSWTSPSGTNADLEVRNCHISHSGYCLYIQNCLRARVHDNDIQPESSSNSDSEYGVYLSAVPSGDTVRVYNNRIHNFQHTGVGNFSTMGGVFATVGTNGCAYIYNNFFWDWHSAGANMAAFMPSTGTTHWYFNTVYMDDQPSGADMGRKSMYYRSTGTAYVKDNVFVSAEDADTVYFYDGITSLTADNNCFYDATAANPNFKPAPGYDSLAAWQATGNDLNSIVGNPGLVSTTDLHIDTLYTLVDSAATPIAGITDDIDGDVRNATFPDMGADEYDALYAPGEEVDSLTIFPDAAAADSGHAILRWRPAAGANSYKVYRGNTYGFVTDETTYIGQTAGTTYTDVGILAAGARFYVVLASTDHIAP
jgi:hypothetical protein